MDYALGQIEELHPLANTPLYVAYPFLSPFKSCLGCCPYMGQTTTAENDLEMVGSDLIISADYLSDIISKPDEIASEAYKGNK